jgi:hypothetical protein
MQLVTSMGSFIGMVALLWGEIFGGGRKVLFRFVVEKRYEQRRKVFGLERNEERTPGPQELTALFSALTLALPTHHIDEELMYAAIA